MIIILFHGENVKDADVIQQPTICNTQHNAIYMTRPHILKIAKVYGKGVLQF